MTHKFKLLSAALVAATLAACGGGSGGGGNGGGSQPVANQDPQGLWNGTSSSGYTIGALVLENGEFWSIFSKNGIAYGVDYGTGTVSGTSISGNIQEFYIPTNQVFAGTLTATFSPKTTMQVNTSYNNGNTSTTALAYNTAYDTPASLAQATGTYTGNYYTGAPVNISISSNGVVSGISNACNIGGNVTPRPTGKNVYNVTLTFSGTNCAPGTGTATGVGVLGTSNGSTYLYTAGLNSTKTNGFFWIGRKQ